MLWIIYKRNKKTVGGINMGEKICGAVILAIIYLLLAWKASDLWRK